MITWLAPVGGLALIAGLPLAIHLLSRRVRRERPFPAIALLARAMGGRAHLSVLRERLALLVRTLMIIALLLAAAAPLWRAANSGTAGAGAPAVIIIDASASMRQRVGATAAWSAAIGAANRITDELAPRPVLLLVAGTPLRRSAPQPETDRGALRALLAEAQPGWGSGSLDAAIAAGSSALSDLRGGDLYVITDGSRSALAGVDPEALPSDSHWHHLAVSGGSANCAVRAIAAEPSSGRVGQPLHLRAEVANFGSEAVELSLRFDVGGVTTDHRLSISAGSSASAERTVTPEHVGQLDLSAVIVSQSSGTDSQASGADALPEDDRRHGTVTVVPGASLQLYSDADITDPSGVVKPLLAAAHAAKLQVSTKPGADLSELRDSDGLALVVTAGLAQADAGPALVEHLRHGGVWLQVTATDHDARLTAAGIDPPSIPGALVDLTSRPRGILLAARRLDHPLTAGLLGREPLLARLEAWRYRPAPPQAGATVLLAWADGSAALALRPVDPGWWIQIGISPADGDTSLAALEMLPLIMAHLSDVAGARRLADAAVPCGAARRAQRCFDPAGTLQPGTDGSVRLDRPGRWLLDDVAVAAAIPASESDLRVSSSTTDETGPRSAAIIIAAIGDRPLWPWCLLAALIFLMIELLVVGGLPLQAKRTP